MSAPAADTLTTARALGEGPGWRAVEVTCRAGPGDAPYEEQHDWAAVAGVMSGTFIHRSDAGRALLTPGSLLLGNVGACFECSHEHGEGDRCVSFHFAPEFVEDAAASLSGVRRASFAAGSIAPVEALLPLFSAMRRLSAAPDPLGLETLALQVAQTALALDADAAPRPGDGREAARAAAAARIIEARYAEPLTVAGLAREVGLTQRRLAHVFRESVGVTPYNYILGRRLDAAASRLLTGREGVLEIALDVGFGDLSEFTRRFSARFGRPPAAFRRSRAP